MKFTRWLIPGIAFRWWPLLFFSALAGAMIAGIYGVVHDQITYTLSPEYFTKFKFFQFEWANPQLPNPRWFVALIGFLATWWVGGIAGWALARLGIFWTNRQGHDPLKQFLTFRLIISKFRIILGTAVGCGVLGYIFCRFIQSPSQLHEWCMEMGVSDPIAFASVGMIHNFGYAGAALGLVVAGISLRRSLFPRTQKNGVPS